MSDAWPITPTVLVALLGWIPVVLALYCAMTPRRATIACFVIGWLFLPVTTGLKIAEGVPAWDKITAITLMALICTAIFDSARFASFRLKWFDLPMIAYTLVPIASCAVSGDGPYEGICASFKCAMIWFGPYFLGRIYITDLDAMSELATGIVAGGLAYAPLCLFESRISPQLHNWAYGYFQHSFAQTYRLGGWRPMVFMQHGLAVGMFMTQASILALWMAVGRSPRKIIGWRLPWIAILMVFTTIMCRSSFAIVLLAVGVLVLVIGWSLNTRIGLILMLLVVPAYMLTRATGLFNAEPLINAVSEYADADRGVCFAVRVPNENLIIARGAGTSRAGLGVFREISRAQRRRRHRLRPRRLLGHRSGRKRNRRLVADHIVDPAAGDFVFDAVSPARLGTSDGRSRGGDGGRHRGAHDRQPGQRDAESSVQSPDGRDGIGLRRDGGRRGAGEASRADRARPAAGAHDTSGSNSQCNDVIYESRDHHPQLPHAEGDD